MGKWIKITMGVLMSLILILGSVRVIYIHKFNQKSQELRWHTLQHFQFAYLHMKDYQKMHDQQDLVIVSRELARASEVIFAYAVIYDPELRDFSSHQLDVLANVVIDPQQAESVKHDLDIIMKFINIDSGKNQEKLGHNRKYFETTLLKASKALPNPLKSLMDTNN